MTYLQRLAQLRKPLRKQEQTATCNGVRTTSYSDWKGKVWRNLSKVTFLFCASLYPFFFWIVNTQAPSQKPHLIAPYYLYALNFVFMKLKSSKLSSAKCTYALSRLIFHFWFSNIRILVNFLVWYFILWFSFWNTY